MLSTQPTPRYLPALTIAGSDCSGGAGIEADLKTFGVLGIYGMAALTAVTAQNGLGVTAVEGVSPSMIEAQVDACFAAPGLRPAAVKTGMLGGVAAVEAVARALARNQARNVVVDPVLVATSGDPLADNPEAVGRAITAHLAPLTLMLTPNVSEARALSGRDTVEEQYAALAAMGFRNVLFKGGDRNDNPLIVTDVLFLEGGRRIDVTHRRVDTVNTHGTGCTLSAAIAGALAEGCPPERAVRRAVHYLELALKDGARVRLGEGHGPVCHNINLLKTNLNNP